MRLLGLKGLQDSPKALVEEDSELAHRGGQLHNVKDDLRFKVYGSGFRARNLGLRAKGPQCQACSQEAICRTPHTLFLFCKMD